MPIPLRQTAIVLRTSQIRDSDLIISLLTEESGKLSALARGARNSKKRFLGGIDLFDCAIFEFQAGKGNEHLLSLTGLSERTPWIGLGKNLLKFYLASFCLELSETLIAEGDPEGAKLFPALRSALSDLNDSATDGESYSSTLFFTILILELSGYHPLGGAIRLTPDLHNWWVQMITANSPLPAPNTGAISQSFSVLLSFIEETTGHRLKTRSDFVWKALSGG